jgi:hypothetical protein
VIKEHTKSSHLCRATGLERGMWSLCNCTGQDDSREGIWSLHNCTEPNNSREGGVLCNCAGQDNFREGGRCVVFVQLHRTGQLKRVVFVQLHRTGQLKRGYSVCAIVQDRTTQERVYSLVQLCRAGQDRPENLQV